MGYTKCLLRRGPKARCDQLREESTISGRWDIYLPGLIYSRVREIETFGNRSARTGAEYPQTPFSIRGGVKENQRAVRGSRESLDAGGLETEEPMVGRESVEGIDGPVRHTQRPQA